MPRWLKFSLIGLTALLVICALSFWHLKTVYGAWTASTSTGEPLFERALLEDYGDQIIGDLARQNVKLAIISRSGQPREDLPKGINYTHSAFWVYDPAANVGGETSPQYAVYNLYHNDVNRLKSRLETDTPADFLKLTREHDVGILIPDTKTQAQLISMIKSTQYAKLHQEDYSLISNPFDLKYQNCNEFMLDVLAAAIWGIQERDDIKARLKTILTPTEIKASPVRKILGPRVDERLIMADHDQIIQTTTRQTLKQFLDSQDRLAKAYILDLAKSD